VIAAFEIQLCSFASNVTSILIVLRTLSLFVTPACIFHGTGEFRLYALVGTLEIWNEMNE